MNTPFFSRRETLHFLINEAGEIEADSEWNCWRAAWAAFSGGVFDRHDDLPFLEFERICQFYGFGPAPHVNGTWKMIDANLETVT